MDSELGLAPPPAKIPPPAPTTITDISDDLLCEIFLLLPSLPSLVRAALACTTFLRAVRSSPAFRRRFQASHPPQLLGFFTDPSASGKGVPTFIPLRNRSDPDLAAAVRGGDFLLTRLPEDSCNPSLVWEVASCHSGYLVLVNRTIDQIAAYNPFRQALDVFPQPPDQLPMQAPDLLLRSPFSGSTFDEFHIVVSQEDQRVFRVVSVQHRIMQRQVQACIAVFSSATREWKVSPWVDTPTPLEPEDDGEEMLMFYPGMQLNGLVYWKHASRAYLLVLNTETMQLSRVDLLPVLGEVDSSLFRIGQTKDGKLCVVAADDSDAKTGTLVIWFWGADDDGVEKWMLEDIFDLSTFVDASKPSTEGDVTVQIEAVIDGFLYLSIKYDEHTRSLLSLCLETEKLNKLFDDTYATPAHPYIMAWPSFLICNKVNNFLNIKENSKTKVAVDCVADNVPAGTEESPSVLVASLQSYKEALINGDVAKVAEIEALFASHRG